jgi:hypothetical protein
MQKAALLRFAALLAALGALVSGAFEGDFIWP